jgi:hypothetical protein
MIGPESRSNGRPPARQINSTEYSLDRGEFSRNSLQYREYSFRIVEYAKSLPQRWQSNGQKKRKSARFFPLEPLVWRGGHPYHQFRIKSLWYRGFFQAAN